MGRRSLESEILFSGDYELDTKRMKALLLFEGINQKYIVDVTAMSKADVSHFISRSRVFKKLIIYFEHLAIKHQKYFESII